MITQDNYMTYDFTKHMYIPTQELIQEKLNINLVEELGGENEKNNFLEDCAYFVKDFCLHYGITNDISKRRQQIEWIIFKNANQERDYLQRAYVEYVRYAINDEGDLVGTQTGLNVVQGQVLSVNELRGRRELSSRLERTLKNGGLLFRGRFVFDIPTTDQYGVDY